MDFDLQKPFEQTNGNSLFPLNFIVFDYPAKCVILWAWLCVDSSVDEGAMDVNAIYFGDDDQSGTSESLKGMTRTLI